MSRAEPMAVVICVPVRDEARNLPALFSTLATQRPVRQTVCVAMVFDGCRDESRSVAIQSARAHRMDIHIECLPIAAPSAGRARGAALALGRNLVGTTGVLLTTDADTRPNADWVARSIAAMQEADFVCGYIGRRRGMAEGARQEIEGYLDRLHKVHRTIDPVEGDAAPSHWHEGGASLGMTARAWDLIGDEPLEASGEDRQLVRRARLAGLRVRQDPRVRVRTSSRMKGRASGGLADALRHGRAEHAAGILPSMEHPDDVVARFERAAVARAAFPAIDGLADRIGVAPVIVARTATAARSADAFVTALPLVRGPHRVCRCPPVARPARARGGGGMTLVADLRAVLADADTATAMPAAFAIARAARLDDPADDTPRAARALMRRMALAGRADTAFGRLFEGHVNAVQLVRRHGDAARHAVLDDALRSGAILGVWNSDLPGRPLTTAQGRFVGAKNFASGAGIVTHPLVTTDANDPARTQMFLPDLRGDTRAVIDRNWWRPIGMRRSETHIVDLTGIDVGTPIGAPGDYQHQPAFGAGALRFVAVQVGAVHALFDAVRDYLVATDRGDHPIQRHRLSRLFGLADAGYAIVDRTAAAWSTTDATTIVPLVAAARGGVEASAVEALQIAQAAVGVQGLFEGHPLARIVTDLSVYLRQPNPDGARDVAGDAALRGIIVPGVPDA